MDEEIVMMKRNAIIGLIVSIIILVPIICLVVSIYNRIDNEREVFNYILIRDNNCALCDKVEGILNSNNISYKILDKSNSDYYNKLSKYGISSDIKFRGASLVYLENNKMKSYIVDSDVDSSLKFIERVGR